MHSSLWNSVDQVRHHRGKRRMWRAGRPSLLRAWHANFVERARRGVMDFNLSVQIARNGIRSVCIRMALGILKRRVHLLQLQLPLRLGDSLRLQWGLRRYRLYRVYHWALRFPIHYPLLVIGIPPVLNYTPPYPLEDRICLHQVGHEAYLDQASPSLSRDINIKPRATPSEALGLSHPHHLAIQRRTPQKHDDPVHPVRIHRHGEIVALLAPRLLGEACQPLLHPAHLV